MKTRLGVLKRGDLFVLDGAKYELRSLVLGKNGYVACIDTAAHKIKRFRIDTDVEVTKVKV